MTVASQNDVLKEASEVSESPVSMDEIDRSETESPATSADSATEKPSKKKKADKKEKKSKPPKFSAEVKDVQVEEGGQAKFTCKVKGTPLPEVEWFHNGKKIQPSDMFIMTTEGDVHSLLIKKVSLDFVGTYTAKVSPCGIVAEQVDTLLSWTVHPKRCLFRFFGMSFMAQPFLALVSSSPSLLSSRRERLQPTKIKLHQNIIPASHTPLEPFFIRNDVSVLALSLTVTFCALVLTRFCSHLLNLFDVCFASILLDPFSTP